MEKNAASVISTGGVEEEGGTPRPGDSYVQSFARGLGLSLRQIRYRIDRLNIALPGDASAEADGGGHGES